MSRPIEARVSLAAIRHNYAAARAAAPGAKVLAVVKANAYGHGVERVARALREVDGFATLELASALACREHHPGAPVLLLEGFFCADELPILARHRIAAAVHCEAQLSALEGAGALSLDAWLKVNTGMNRLGFPVDQVPAALARLRACPAVRTITLMTHFASSEVPGGVTQAVARFEAATAGVELPRSLANTAAIFSQPRTHADIVRLGIGLYGATPFADRSSADLGLRPAMTLASALIAVQQLRRGDTVGYGRAFTAERDMRIGVVACGYADGYPRHAPSGTPVTVAGVRTRTVGRVSMDMITVDLEPVPHAVTGAAVELWGETLPVDEVALAAGTVGYELLCAVAPRVPFREEA